MSMKVKAEPLSSDDESSNRPNSAVNNKRQKKESRSPSDPPTSSKNSRHSTRRDSDGQRRDHYQNEHDRKHKSSHDRRSRENNDRFQAGRHRKSADESNNDSDTRSKRAKKEESGREDRRRNEQRRIEHDDYRSRLAREAGVKPSEAGHEWGRGNAQVPSGSEQAKVPIEKEKPNFALSGKLAQDTNTFNGVVITYSEPPEARKPKTKWRLYPFKGDEALDVLYVHRQSAYLIGRDRRVCDIPIDHPSCSKQHAALQYRAVRFERSDGSTGATIKPYVIDLNSANGTYLNNERIEGQRYIELKEKDVIKFGFSTREYVVLNERSQSVDDTESPTNDEHNSLSPKV